MGRLTDVVSYSRRAMAYAHVWHIADGTGQTLGRFASRVAVALMGKYKPTARPGGADVGDYVVIRNADKVVLTGNKETDKTYWWHTNYMASDRTMTHSQFKARHPSGPLRKAIYGMLPKNDLRKVYMRRLFIFTGDSIPPRLASNALRTPTDLCHEYSQYKTPEDSLAPPPAAQDAATPRPYVQRGSKPSRA